MAAQHREGGFKTYFPEADGVVARAGTVFSTGRSQSASIGAKHEFLDGACVTPEDCYLPPAHRLPQPHRVIGARRSNQFSVGAVHRRQYLSGMTLEGKLGRLPGAHVPLSNRSIR